MCLLAYDANDFLNTPLARTEQNFELQVKPGDTVRGIGSRLSDHGLMRRPLWWEMYARYTGTAQKIRTGEFTLSTSLTPIALLAELQAGREKQYSLTILEGWNIWQLRAAVDAHEVLKHTIADIADDDLMRFIGAQPGHAEGQFLPDTYNFPRGTTDAEFLLRAHMAMNKEVAEIWATRRESLPIGTPYEAQILASIIEKETGVASERELISGVMVARLNKGMRLQTDPTVIYGIGKNFNGNITRKDLKAKTPYNTYVIKGLPPTPIAMPGIDALRAAVTPQDTKALFFVADGTGGHVFSETIDQHNAAVRKYLLKK